MLADKPTRLVVDASSEVKIEERDVDEPSAKRIHSRSTTHAIAAMIQSISMDHVSIICNFVELTDIDVQFAET